MKKILALLLMFILVAGLVACAPKEETLADYGVPEDFNIYYSHAIAAPNYLDTYNNTLQKDLVASDKGVAKAEVVLTAKQKAEIYEKLQEYEISSITENMTSENLTQDGTGVYMTPLTQYVIRFTCNGKEYTVTGDGTAQHYPNHPQAKNFMDFVRYMRDFYYNLPEYKALPAAEGGYC